MSAPERADGMTLVDIDAARPMPTVEIDGDGLAVTVRYAGRPVGFWMEKGLGDRVLDPVALGARVGRHCGGDILRAVLDGPAVEEPLTTTVTLVVCTKDRPTGLDRVLGSLAEVAAAAPPRLDVLVVDNASTDPEVATVAARHGARYVVEPRPGLDFARNRALAEARGDWVAFFDDDVVVDPGWAGGLAAALRAHPDAAAVTGLVLPLHLDTGAQVLFERRGGFRQGFRRVRFGNVHETDDAYPAGAGHFGTGANTAVHVASAVAIGGFDEALDAGSVMPGGGDLDIYYRMVRSGRAVVYEPRCVVRHDHRREADALERQFHDSWGLSFHAFIAKCRAVDPARRAEHRRYLARWYRSMVGETARALRGRSDVPARMLVAELRGAVRGAFGAYPEAVARTAAIRREHG